jgi:hypothetical protein
LWLVIEITIVVVVIGGVGIHRKIIVIAHLLLGLLLVVVECGVSSLVLLVVAGLLVHIKTTSPKTHHTPSLVIPIHILIKITASTTEIRLIIIFIHPSLLLSTTTATKC